MDKKITVIIPVFNSEKYIKTTLNSLLNQSIGFENLEVIIIDDCSTDTTPNIIKEYSNIYSNIKCLFLEKNYGSPGKARNEGIKNASTDYIMFLDSDDEYAQDMCEILYSTITNEKVDFVFCRYDIYTNNEFNNHNKSFLNKYSSKIKIDSILEHTEMISTCSNLVVWNKIYNKNFLLENNITFIEDSTGEDLLFGYEVFLSSNTFISINDYFGYKYHIHINSISHNNSCKSFEDGLYILNKIEKLFKDKEFYEFEVVNEYIIIWTQSIFNSNIPTNKKRQYLNEMKRYYKKYNLFYRLINNMPLPFNIVINIFIKLFSLSSMIAVIIANSYSLIFKK